MKYYLLTLLILIAETSAAQTDYYRYNSAGVPEKVGYTEPAQRQTFPPYRGVDVGLYAGVGLYKQQQYDNNVRNLKTLIESIHNVLIEIGKYDQEFVDGTITNLNKYIENISGSDYSNRQVYEGIYNTLYKFKKEIEVSKETIIENYYGRKYGK
jgi:hypothetical protein